MAEGQPFRLRLMAAVLKAARDPDFEFLVEAEQGLPVGVDVPLPRTPAAFERQTKWRLDDYCQDGMLERKNYPSAEEHAEHLMKRLEAEVSEGLVEKMTDAQFVETFGEKRVVASLAVLVEDEAAGKKRVIHNGTHGVGVNNRILWCLDR